MYRLVLAGLLLSVAAMPTSAQQTTLKFGIFVPERERTVGLIMKPFAEKATAASNNTLEIKLYPNGALGRHPARQLKMIRDGVADIAFVIPAYSPGRFPDNDVFELPGIMRTSKEASLLTWRLLQNGLLRGYEDYEVIGLFASPPYTIHMRNKVASLGELKGKKIRAVGPVMTASINALGAAPEAMPFPKVVEALSRGVIDGTIAHPIVLFDFGVYRVAKHHVMGRLGVLPIAILMNKKKFDGLPDVAKAGIRKNSGEMLSVAYGESTDVRNAELMATWSKDPTHSVVRLSAADEAKWQATLKPVVDGWVGKHPNGVKLLTSLRSELAKIRSKK